jgi:hypothetical protein
MKKNLIMQGTTLLGLVLIISLFTQTACKSKHTATGEQVISDITCDAEALTPGGRFFLGSKSGYLFTNNHNQTSEKAHSGSYSAKVDKTNAFGMDYLAVSVDSGNYYKVSVWRFPAGSKGIIVACIGSPKEFYSTNVKVEKTDDKGWELISLEFKVPASLNKRNMGIDLWYPADEGFTFFDDLEIKRFTK